MTTATNELTSFIAHKSFDSPSRPQLEVLFTSFPCHHPVSFSPVIILYGGSETGSNGDERVGTKTDSERMIGNGD